MEWVGSADRLVPVELAAEGGRPAACAEGPRPGSASFRPDHKPAPDPLALASARRSAHGPRHSSPDQPSQGPVPIRLVSSLSPRAVQGITGRKFWRSSLRAGGCQWNRWLAGGQVRRHSSEAAALRSWAGRVPTFAGSHDQTSQLSTGQPLRATCRSRATCGLLGTASLTRPSFPATLLFCRPPVGGGPSQSQSDDDDDVGHAMRLSLSSSEEKALSSGKAQTVQGKCL